MFHRLGSVIIPVLLVLILITSNLFGQSGYKSEEELIRAAEKFFNEKNYEKAFPLFSQIVSNRPDNSHYNYCLGVCIMEVAPDKAEAVRFLELATKSPQNPNDSWLYLGKAYHSSYKYDEAISAFQSYKINAGRSSWNNANGDALIQMCKNGIDVKNDLSLQRHRILEKSETAAIDFFLLYKNIPEVGRFLKLPKEYEDKSTKGSNESAYVFLPSTGNTLVYSNASKSNGKGFDIFRVIKDQKGLWMFPEMLSDVINSSSDEAFPIVVNDGKTLYFSSKGSRSTGGYDIFRSDLDLSTSTWSEPIPMGPPINSPGDDFYYVPSLDNKFAYFSSNRESAAGKCDVYKVAIINETRNFIAISGFFNCKSGLELSEAKVTIMNPDDRSIVAQFRTPSQEGNYNLKLPVPSKFIYMVELAGFNSQEQLVDLSDYSSPKLLQEIYLVRTDEAKEVMTITNRIPIDGNVIAGNKSALVPSITQNVGDRDMALATTSSRNGVATSKQSNSDVDFENGESNTTPVVDQNSNQVSKESTSSTASAQKTNEPLSEKSNGSKSNSTTAPSTTTSPNTKDNSSTAPSTTTSPNTKTNSPSAQLTAASQNTKTNSSAASNTNSEPIDLVTIENLSTSADKEKQQAIKNIETANNEVTSKSKTSEHLTANSDSKNVDTTSLPGSVSVVSTPNSSASSNSTESTILKSNEANSTNSKASNSNINVDEVGLAKNTLERTNSTSGEMVTASTMVATPIENSNSNTDTKIISDSEKQNDQPEKNASSNSGSTNGNSKSTDELNRTKHSDGSTSISNSSSTHSTGNLTATNPAGTTQSKNSEVMPEGNTTSSPSSTTSSKVENNSKSSVASNSIPEIISTTTTKEENSLQAVDANSGNYNQNSIPTASSNVSKAETKNEISISAEAKRSNDVASPESGNLSTIASPEVTSGNKQSSTVDSDPKSNTSTNKNSAGESSLSATPKVSSTQSTTSESNSVKNTKEKSSSTNEGAQVSQPAGQTTPLANNSHIATDNTTSSDAELKYIDESIAKEQKSNSSVTPNSSQTESGATSNNMHSTHDNDPSNSTQKHSDKGTNQSTSTSGKSENTQATTSEVSTNNQTTIPDKNLSQNSSQPVEMEIGSEITSVEKSEKRSGIFGNRSKKKENEIVTENNAIPEFATAQPSIVDMPEPPKNLIFRVQVGAYKDKNADDLKKKYADIGITDLIYVRNEEGLLLVMTGSEKSYETALTLKTNMIEKGVADAFIVAYSDGSRLPLESVVKIAE